MNTLTGNSYDWSQTYVYDKAGNRAVTVGDSWLASDYTPWSWDGMTVPFNERNQWNLAAGYDGAGNMTALRTQSMVYDAEERLIRWSDSSNGATASFTYDGHGRRVTKTGGSGTTVYVYDPAGNLAAEYGGPANAVAGVYLTEDQQGSTRLVTNVSGGVVGCHDYLPFGEEIPGTIGRSAVTCYGQPDTAVKYTGQLRDSETGFDYYLARYMARAQGRFLTPDPISGTVLQLLNPQRWNMYTYAVNNPLAYTDPDGRDAIAVKFGNGAHGLGHAGVASVHHDGKGTFADFSPQHQGSAHDAGKYTFDDFKTQIQYGADGKPTKASLTALANELADSELQPRDSVSVAYFKTSDAETAALDAYINAARAQQAQGRQSAYWVGFRDCIWFCQNGLAKAGIESGSTILTIPNLQYLDFWFTADQTATGTKQKEQVTSKICYTDENGKQVCQ